MSLKFYLADNNCLTITNAYNKLEESEQNWQLQNCIIEVCPWSFTLKMWTAYYITPYTCISHPTMQTTCKGNVTIPDQEARAILVQWQIVGIKSTKYRHSITQILCSYNSDNSEDSHHWDYKKKVYFNVQNVPFPY